MKYTTYKELADAYQRGEITKIDCEIVMSWGDDPTPEDSAVGVICSALRAKVNAIVREGFEGWNGTITTGKYKMHVDLTLEKEE